MSNQVASLVAQAQTVAQQGREAAAKAEISGDASLDAISARTRATVSRIADDLFEKRVLDPYLRFNSPEEEAEYRRREAEREAYIKRELAKGTPEGNRNAADAALDQIDDAGRHGADQSPDFAAMRAEAQAARDELKAAMRPQNAGAEAVKANPAHEASTPPSDLDEIAAIFKAAGVQSPPEQSAEAKGHGLATTTVERSGSQPGRPA